VRTLFLGLILTITSLTAYCQDNPQTDTTVNIIVNGKNAYYQKAVKVDSNIMESMIYLRSLEFMAAKNFQQTYGYEQEGKLICTTSQDLNTNNIYIGDDSDEVDQYTVQFAITLDMKNKKYRYTIHNVVFFRPAETGNRRLTLYDMYIKATNTQSKRVAKDAKKVIDSFEKYLNSLTNELYLAIEHKSPVDSTKF